MVPLMSGIRPWKPFLSARFFRACMLAVTAATVAPSITHAHHTVSGVPIRSSTCGWIEGESLRDVRHLSDFCAESVPAGFHIISVTANRERLWIEAPSDLVARMRAGDEQPRALLRTWLEQWRVVTG